MQFNRRALLVGAAVVGACATARVPYAFAQAADGPFKQIPLPYAADKNEPHIDAMTMEIHHGRHHVAFINNLNAAAKGNPKVFERPIEQLLADLPNLPEAVRTVVRNSGGGHANHTMFWQVMGGSGGDPTGEVAKAIEASFGDFAKLKEQFNGAGGRLFGSGWVFVTVSKDGKLALVTKPNQDTPLFDKQMVLFGNDVWEHAYYLKYQNRRADYLNSWWNVVNWDVVNERFAAAKEGKLTI